MYKDTYGYFLNSEFRNFLINTSKKNTFKKVLEIGSYEGIFSCYAAENFADVVHTVDPFILTDPGTSVSAQTEINFEHNISICPAGKKIIRHKETSDSFFSNNQIIFDLVYVDGSHEPNIAYTDLNNSLKFCNNDGIIWIDDYGSGYKTLRQEIDKWLSENLEKIEIIHKSYQVGLIKKY